MTIKSVTLPPLRLRPITEAPLVEEIITALIIVVDETEGEDNIGAMLYGEPFSWSRRSGWTGEISGCCLPRNAVWWLPEHDLTAAPTDVARREAAVRRIWEGA